MIYRNLLFSVGWFVIALIGTSTANAACGLGIAAGNPSIDWTMAFDYKSFTLTITKGNSTACSYGIAFTKGGAASYATRRATVGANSARYQIYGDTTKTFALKDVPDIAAPTDVILDTYLEGDTTQHQLQFFIEVPYSATLYHSGSFTDSFTLNVYEGADPLTWVTPVATTTVTLTINIPKIIALSLLDGGGAFDESKTTKNINFGTLAPGQNSSMDIRMRSNAGYEVRFSSANNGSMKHTAGAALVPYLFYVNGVQLNMSNSLAVPVLGLSSNGTTLQTGSAYPINVRIGAFVGSGRVAGSYSDQITVTAATTE
ncbi:MAG TPA: hypothetical protein DCS07_01615 [Bdellovibrionales bacterium]|nr:MAG: hypothetical protein A2X97_06765 [Bdellovibrionales bacterium GWA1_52_35]OFZ40365.1 MAG: hypothetical protein A2070_15200 [Bdellovibrionales bacterium GWC1_52_8]HAR41322.1 hypothetical protein [Bdellovibrionales bacterium]HCM40806.1 hypothetical protein [Bdellovibrionales bacterium]